LAFYRGSRLITKPRQQGEVDGQQAAEARAEGSRASDSHGQAAGALADRGTPDTPSSRPHLAGQPGRHVQPDEGQRDVSSYSTGRPSPHQSPDQSPGGRGRARRPGSGEGGGYHSPRGFGRGGGGYREGEDDRTRSPLLSDPASSVLPDARPRTRSQTTWGAAGNAGGSTSQPGLRGGQDRIDAMWNRLRPGHQ
jgi:hypothetical protein